MFKNKTYIVTGASSGIGESIRDMLLAENAHVIGIGRNTINISEPGFHNFTADFEKPAVLEKVFKDLIKQQSPIDGLICAAGQGRFGAIEQFSFAQMQSMMSVNFMAHALLVRLLLPILKQQAKGDVIFIGSEAALAGSKNGAMYCASKFALRGFAQALREECAKSDVRISMINPGMVKTPFFDSLKFKPGDDEANYCLPEDVSNAVKLILSTRSGTCFDEINLSPLKKVIQFE